MLNLWRGEAVETAEGARPQPRQSCELATHTEPRNIIVIHIVYNFILC